MRIEERFCSGFTRPSGGIGTGFPCCNAAKVERDGKWYCGVHDPVKEAEREERREAKRRQADDAVNALRSAARDRQEKLGMGSLAWSIATKHGWTGGLTLTAEECDALIEKLKKVSA